MKRILIFNDISGLGNCSMVANLPVLTALGHYCAPVPTACYSCQTGFDNFSVLPNSRVAEFARNIADNCAVDAVYVGFCSDTATLKAVQEAAANVLPNGGYLFVDPIMGDNGKLYPVFDGEYVKAIKELVRRADCISPNLTEACLLADVDYAELISKRDRNDFLAACGEAFSSFLDKVGAKNAVITGIELNDVIGNIALSANGIRYVTNERVKIAFSGTGDLFSATLLGKLLNGASLVEATVTAADFVGKAAALTPRSDKRFGVDFWRVLRLLEKD